MLAHVVLEMDVRVVDEPREKFDTYSLHEVEDTEQLVHLDKNKNIIQYKDMTGMAFFTMDHSRDFGDRVEISNGLTRCHARIKDRKIILYREPDGFLFEYMMRSKNFGNCLMIRRTTQCFLVQKFDDSVITLHDKKGVTYKYINEAFLEGSNLRLKIKRQKYLCDKETFCLVPAE